MHVSAARKASRRYFRPMLSLLALTEVSGAAILGPHRKLRIKSSNFVIIMQQCTSEFNDISDSIHWQAVVTITWL